MAAFVARDHSSSSDHANFHDCTRTIIDNTCTRKIARSSKYYEQYNRSDYTIRMGSKRGQSSKSIIDHDNESVVSSTTRQLLSARVQHSIKERGVDPFEMLKDGDKNIHYEMTPIEKQKRDMKRLKNKEHARQSRERRNLHFLDALKKCRFLKTETRILRTIVELYHQRLTGHGVSWCYVDVERPSIDFDLPINTNLDILKQPFGLKLPADIFEQLAICKAVHAPYKIEELYECVRGFASRDIEDSKAQPSDKGPEGPAINELAASIFLHSSANDYDSLNFQMKDDLIESQLLLQYDSNRQCQNDANTIKPESNPNIVFSGKKRDNIDASYCIDNGIKISNKHLSPWMVDSNMEMTPLKIRFKEDRSNNSIPILVQHSSKTQTTTLTNKLHQALRQDAVIDRDNVNSIPMLQHSKQTQMTTTSLIVNNSLDPHKSQHIPSHTPTQESEFCQFKHVSKIPQKYIKRANHIHKMCRFIPIGEKTAPLIPPPLKLCSIDDKTRRHPLNSRVETNGSESDETKRICALYQDTDPVLWKNPSDEEDGTIDGNNNVSISYHLNSLSRNAVFQNTDEQYGVSYSNVSLSSLNLHEMPFEEAEHLKSTLPDMVDQWI